MDITWKTSDGVFSLRAGAILRRGDEILLCATDGLDGWHLPGGRVEFGESAAEAVLRELREEAELTLTVGDLVLVTEDRVTLNGILHHEICFYYAISWPDDLHPNTAQQNAIADHTFRWFPLADLSEIQMLPPHMTDYLLQPSTGLHHLSIDRRASHQR